MNTQPPVQGLTIPPELQRSLPREVTLTANGVAVMVIATLLIIGSFVGGIALYATRQREVARYSSEVADAAATSGVVISVNRIPGKDERYRVQFAYTVAETRYTSLTRMPRLEGRQFHPGMPVTVEYVRSNPGRSWLAGHAPEAVPAFLPFVIGLSMILPGAIILWSVRRQRTMLERGRAAIGRVTSTRRFRGHNRRATFYVYYEFTTYSGAVSKGRGNANKQGEPVTGSEVVVLYDMDNPKRTALYPLQMVRVRQD
jgi:Protein of unknown function (DUF3592)